MARRDAGRRVRQRTDAVGAARTHDDGVSRARKVSADVATHTNPVRESSPRPRRAVGKRAVTPNRLALIRAICVSRRPSTRPRTLVSQKFFSRAGPRHVDFFARRKMRHKVDAHAGISEKAVTRDAAEVAGSSALLLSVDFRSQNRAAGKFFDCEAAAAAAMCVVGGVSKCELRTKQLKSLLIFSCCSNPVSSARRFATALHVSRHPPNSGGQQWRRRERKRQRRNRPRSVGRRSSLRCYRFSTLLWSKIASHGPAGSAFIGDQGRPSDRRRASAGRRFKLHDRKLANVKRTEKKNLPLAQMPADLILKTSRRSPRFVGGVFSELATASWSNPWRRFS
jgi:hypothetical protein